MHRQFVSAILIAVTIGAVFGQEFEVASIKPNQSGSGSSSVRVTKGTVTMENVTLKKCIALAYNIGEDRDYALSGSAKLSDDRYDIVAKFPPDTPQSQVALMLQALIADRFKLKVHHEMRELPVYALIVSNSKGKNGPKLQSSAPGSATRFDMTAGRLSARAASMAALADRLSGSVFQLGRPVIDMTELKGAYDLTLDWVPDAIPPDDASGASIFTALQEQLGLKLEPRKGPVDVLVVDHFEKPSEN